MKKTSSFFLRLPVLCCTLVLAAANAAVFRACRMIWVFYDPFLRFIGGARGMFALTLAVLGLSVLLLTLRLFAPQKIALPPRRGVCAALGGVCFVLTVLFAAAFTAVVFISGAETDKVILLYLKKDLPVLLGFAAALVLLLVFPRLGAKGKTVGFAAAALCFAAVSLWLLGVRGAYKLVSAPVVMDTGSDYAVVFATNDKGTGFVSYNVGGEPYTVYDQTGGRRVGGHLIHTVHVPYTDLKNNSYEIGSTRMIEEYSYGSLPGKTVTSGPFTLRVNESDEQTYLLISDWHSYLKDAKNAIAHLGAYDAVLLLGDPAAGMDYEEQAVQNIVQFAGELTGGEMPVIYVRGNHETRGAFADELPERLGYDRLYYTTDRGPYSFLVLDSGEDKPDDHIEYGGMDDYAVNRSAMLDWLKTVKVKNDKLIVLTHAWQVSEPEPDLSKAAWDTFSALGARFVLSGHMHICEFYTGRTDEERAFLAAYPDITTYIDGGHAGKTYIASKLTLSPESARIEAVDNAGTVIQDRSLTW